MRAPCGERGLRRVAFRQHEGASARRAPKAPWRARRAPRAARRSARARPRIRGPSSAGSASWPLAARMPSAIGRSKRLESFGRSAGARLTVMRRAGNSKCAVVERGAHAVARFPHFGVGQADDVECRQPGAEVHLDGDLGRIDARERAARDGSDRHAPSNSNAGAPLRFTARCALRARRCALRAPPASACARSSSFFCTSKSSRITRSRRSNQAASRARRFFSRSCAGESRSASSMRCAQFVEQSAVDHRRNGSATPRTGRVRGRAPRTSAVRESPRQKIPLILTDT